MDETLKILEEFGAVEITDENILSKVPVDVLKKALMNAEFNEHIKVASDLFAEKNVFLTKTFGNPMSFDDFYADLFLGGRYFQNPSEALVHNGVGNGIMTVIHENGSERYSKNVLIHSDMNLSLLNSDDFIIIPPVSFFGERKTLRNSHLLFAIVIDVDGVNLENLKNLVWEMQPHDNKPEFLIPASYIVSSGNGVHVYYLLEEPIECFDFRKPYLKELKYILTNCVWNAYTSSDPNVQHQPIVQGYRAVGSATKLGAGHRVLAFKTGERVSFECLYERVARYKASVAEKKSFWSLDDFYKIKKGKTRYTLEEAKEKFPDWYENRVVKHLLPNKWHVKRDLYDWWKNKKMKEATVGHRYFCIMALVIFGMKCDVDFEEVKSDAYSFIDTLDALSDPTSGRFTKKDVDAALMCYDIKYSTFPRADLEKLTSVSMPAGKRNYLKRKDHLAVARSNLKIKSKLGVISVDTSTRFTTENAAEKGRNGGLKGTKEQIVVDYLRKHPEARKIDVIQETGLNKRTVYKYYDKAKESVTDSMKNE